MTTLEEASDEQLMLRNRALYGVLNLLREYFPNFSKDMELLRQIWGQDVQPLISAKVGEKVAQ